MFYKTISVFLFLFSLGEALTVTTHYKVSHLAGIDINQLRQAELTKHNQLRAKHGCPPLVLDSTLNNAAQAYS